MTSVLWLRPRRPGNVSVGRHRIAERLEQRGHLVRVEDVGPADFGRAAEMARGADVVIGTTRAGAYAGAVAARRTGAALVVDHVDPVGQLWRTERPWVAAPAHLLETCALVAADHVVYVNEEDGDRVRRWSSGCSKTTLGVPFDAFKPPEDRERVKREHGFDKRVAAYVGTLSPTYNVDLMLEAVRGMDGWTLLVLGDGPLAGAVRDAAREDRSVVYPGSVPHEEVPPWLWASDVGLCLADDPHTVKVLEYAAAGLPVVHLDGDARKVYGDEVRYTTADPEGVRAWTELAADEGQRPGLRGRAKDRDYERVADAYEGAIGAVLDNQ